MNIDQFESDIAVMITIIIWSAIAGAAIMFALWLFDYLSRDEKRDHLLDHPLEEWEIHVASTEGNRMPGGSDSRPPKPAPLSNIIFDERTGKEYPAQPSIAGEPEMVHEL